MASRIRAPWGGIGNLVYIDENGKGVYDDGRTPGAAAGQPGADSSGNGGNPDRDIHDNLLEHAVWDTPNSGVPNHPAFCTELVNSATGQADAM